tara:strand:- start:858 stop:1124 length:267 start_codon:yes stop_codon:yes gene_type:complete
MITPPSQVSSAFRAHAVQHTFPGYSKLQLIVDGLVPQNFLQRRPVLIAEYQSRQLVTLARLRGIQCGETDGTAAVWCGGILRGKVRLW